MPSSMATWWRSCDSRWPLDLATMPRIAPRLAWPQGGSFHGSVPDSCSGYTPETWARLTPEPRRPAEAGRHHRCDPTAGAPSWHSARPCCPGDPGHIGRCGATADYVVVAEQGASSSAVKAAVKAAGGKVTGRNAAIGTYTATGPLRIHPRRQRVVRGRLGRAREADRLHPRGQTREGPRARRRRHRGRQRTRQRAGQEAGRRLDGRP